MIIPKENRSAMLIAHGVPPEFLDALDNQSIFETLGFILNGPENAYGYLQDIYPHYQCINNYDVTPIYCGMNGDTLYVLLSRDDEVRFVYFALEVDAIYKDFGADFMYMLADFMIDAYEGWDSLDLSALGELGIKLGFKKAPELMAALKKANTQGLRKTFASDQAWRDENIHLFV